MTWHVSEWYELAKWSDGKASGFEIDFLNLISNDFEFVCTDLSRKAALDELKNN